ncbi:distal tail protein [Pectobacterium phage My1]|uniref:Distal tail protein n=1 Tax=Pectobacterium phage My1 TaxID=1204539 RepID=J9QPY7_9CAUD|nr:distal tail protein [Pectobacterium phage My1]AFQ22291.1 hypothetical protein My1_132 [Pectobacterium phage My1]
MRLPDPFTHPGYEGLGFDSVALIDNDPVLRDELPNGKVSEVKNSAQYWGIDIQYPDMFPDEYAILSSTLLGYKSQRTTLEVVLPQYESFRVRGTTSAVTIASGQKGNKLVMGNVGSLEGEPKVGDLFKFSNHTKVYKITSFTKTSSTQWTLGLYPDIFKTTTGAEKPVFTGIVFTTKLMNGDSFRESLSHDGVYTGLSLQLREHIS